MKATRWLKISLPWLLIVVVGLLGFWLRYSFIEPSNLEHQCDGGAGPYWCAWRQLAVQGFLTYAYGYIALAVTVAALIWKHPFGAWLAAALGAFALQLYCYDAGAIALLIGCLRLLRLQATHSATPSGKYRQGHGEIQPQP